MRLKLLTAPLKIKILKNMKEKKNTQGSSVQNFKGEDNVFVLRTRANYYFLLYCYSWLIVNCTPNHTITSANTVILGNLSKICFFQAFRDKYSYSWYEPVLIFLFLATMATFLLQVFAALWINPFRTSEMHFSKIQNIFHDVSRIHEISSFEVWSLVWATGSSSVRKGLIILNPENAFMNN